MIEFAFAMLLAALVFFAGWAVTALPEQRRDQN